MTRRDDPKSRQALALVCLFVGVTPSVSAAEIPVARQIELRNLLQHDCGSCHGIRMNGGLGPALRPVDLAGKSTEMLVDVVLNGREGTPMPAWLGLLDERDAQWLIATLRQAGGG